MLTTIIRRGNLALRPGWLERFATRHPTFALWAAIYLVLPLLGWLAMRAPGRRAVYLLVLLFASTYAAITARTFTEAVAGQPFFLASFL